MGQQSNKTHAPSPTHAESSRTLLDQGRTATLSTWAVDPPGYPFGSLVNFAVHPGGDIFLLLSDLAEHTHNLRTDARASLMVAQSDEVEPLAAGRLTLLGDLSPTGEEARDIYLKRNPAASQYVDFKDFHFFRLTVKSVRFVGGFGRMSWVDLESYRQALPDPIVPHAAGILAHMNEDHTHNMLEMVRHQTGLEASAALMTAVDRYGFDLRIETATKGSESIRLGFLATLQSIEEVRPAMVELVRLAREGIH